MREISIEEYVKTHPDSIEGWDYEIDTVQATAERLVIIRKMAERFRLENYEHS